MLSGAGLRFIRQLAVWALRIDTPYRSGKVKTWLKIKNPDAPATLRFQEEILLSIDSTHGY